LNSSKTTLFRRIIDVEFEYVMTRAAETGQARQGSPSPPTERVVAVMRLLATNPGHHYSLAQISRALNISRSTALTILTTLVAFDWATRDPHTAGFGCGSAFASLATSAEAAMLHADLEDLATDLGTQAFLTQLQGDKLIVIDVAGHSQTSTPPIRRGMSYPMMAPCQSGNAGPGGSVI
jgi:DNA-binding IclR family transcriptional regulator